MTNLTVRNFVSSDIPQIMALQETYLQVYPNANVIPGEVYLTPGFENGNNIFCAQDEGGIVQGYAPLLPVFTDVPQLPHIVWAEVKVNPNASSVQNIKDALYERITHRVLEISWTHSGHPVELTFQYHPSETESTAFVISKGCTYSESVFRMMRNLSEEIQATSSPDKIEIRRLRMETEEEQQMYVHARNEAFPEAPLTLSDWRAFTQSSAWDHGVVIAAYDQQIMVGSVTVFRGETICQQIGMNAGFTEHIFVQASWRNQGLARSMIQQALAYLKEQGCEIALLEVKALNQNALRLYTGLGYRIVNESRLYSIKVGEHP